MSAGDRTTPWRRWPLIALAMVSLWPGTVWAMSDVDILLNKLVGKGILTTNDAEEIRHEMAAQNGASTKPLAKEVVPESARNWTWDGDMRLREEYRNRTGSGLDTNRQRIRFRYGFEAKVSDHLKAGARMATGNTTDPISTNQSFNTSFNHKTIVFDRAYLRYTPELPGVNEFKLTGGMIENPFWVVGQLMWDDDLNFDGAAVRLAKQFGPVTFFTNDGVFLLQTDVTEASTLWSTQGGVAVTPLADAREEVLKHLKITGALAYHDYMNVTEPLSENTAITTAGGSKGNSAGIDDLNLLDSTFEIASQYADVPVSLFSDWVANTATGKGNNGFQIGMKFGKATTPFDVKKGWEGGYYFERLEPDATFGAFTDSDLGNGGTNHLAHTYWVKVATLKNSTLQLKYFNTKEVKGTKNHADTFQADWVTKF